MLHNKFIRAFLYFLASFGFLVMAEISYAQAYSTTNFRRDLLVATFIAVNTIFITPVVLRFFQKSKA